MPCDCDKHLAVIEVVNNLCQIASGIVISMHSKQLGNIVEQLVELLKSILKTY